MSAVGSDAVRYTGDPYPGLRPFRWADAEVFFGRDREARDLRSLWLANRLTVMFGHSGVGKSSLLNAGVLRSLPDEVDRLPVGRVSPAPFSDLSAEPGGNPFTFALLSSWQRDSSAEELRGVTFREFFRGRPPQVDEFEEPLPVLVAIDQFEELFLAPSHLWRHRDRFIDELAAALHELPELRLLVSIREDALASLLPFERRLSPPPRRRMVVRSLSYEAALQAVTLPLRGTSRRFDTGVAEALVEDLRSARATGRGVGAPAAREVEEYVEPVQLQIVCSALWSALPAEVRVITAEDVATYGDVDQTLVAFYDRTVAEIAEEHGLQRDDLRGWIEKTFITEMGTRGMACEGAGQTAGMHNEVARALATRHLLRAEHRLGARWYELQHDRLIGAIQQANRLVGQTAEFPERERDAPMYLRAAQRALAAGELDETGELARRAIQAAELARDPRAEAEGQYLLGQAAGARGDATGARGHHDRALEIFESLRDHAAVAKVYAGLGDVLLALGDEHEALAQYESAVRREPSDSDAVAGHARALWHLGRLDDARGAYERLVGLDADNVTALAARGELLVELNDPARALRDLEQAMELDPDPARMSDLRSARALALAQLGRPEEALAELHAAFEAGTGNVRTYLRGGQVQILLGRPGEALELIRKARREGGTGLFPYEIAKAAELERELTE